MRTKSSPWRAIMILLAGAVATALYLDAVTRGLGNMTGLECDTSHLAPALQNAEGEAHLWAILAYLIGIALSIAAAAVVLYERSRWWIAGTIVAAAGLFVLVNVTLVVLGLGCM